MKQYETIKIAMQNKNNSTHFSCVAIFHEIAIKALIAKSTGITSAW